jgi:hypothetical protein
MPISKTDAVDLCPQSDALWLALEAAAMYGNVERLLAATDELCEKDARCETSKRQAGGKDENR